MTNHDILFNRQELREVLNSMRVGLQQTIDGENPERIAQADEEEYVREMVEKHTLNAPTLRLEDLRNVAFGDTMIDVSGRHDYALGRREGPVHVKGTYVTIGIPFDGDEQLFQFKTSAYGSGMKGAIAAKEKEVQLTFSKLPHEKDQLKGEIEKEVERLQRLLKEVHAQVKQHNDALEVIAREAVKKRKAKIEGDRKLVESLGIPLVKRPEGEVVNAVPIRRKPLQMPQVKPHSVATKSDPVMLDADYREVLGMVKNLSLVIERNPQTFTEMQEQDIRNIILVLLNGVYRGAATGETFNGAGKLDILLRHEGANLFIAECKFWDGEKSLKDAIDQLLKYVTWRDTKTALIMFSRNRDTTQVLAAIKESVKRHKHFRSDLGRTDETTFCYRFVHPGDAAKEFFLTIMVFDVPRKIEK